MLRRKATVRVESDPPVDSLQHVSLCLPSVSIKHTPLNFTFCLFLPSAIVQSSSGQWNPIDIAFDTPFIRSFSPYAHYHDPAPVS